MWLIWYAPGMHKALGLMSSVRKRGPDPAPHQMCSGTLLVIPEIQVFFVYMLSSKPAWATGGSVFPVTHTHKMKKITWVAQVYSLKYMEDKMEGRNH